MDQPASMFSSPHMVYTHKEDPVGWLAFCLFWFDSGAAALPEFAMLAGLVAHTSWVLHLRWTVASFGETHAGASFPTKNCFTTRVTFRSIVRSCSIFSSQNDWCVWARVWSSRTNIFLFSDTLIIIPHFDIDFLFFFLTLLCFCCCVFLLYLVGLSCFPFTFTRFWPCAIPGSSSLLAVYRH